ncbi:MAG: GTPase [Bacteroidota bacterium]
MPDQIERKYILIYNSKSGAFNGMLDSVHKIVSPSTYSCKLCALTHGSFRMKKAWSGFLERHRLKLLIYHSNDIPIRLNEIERPAILNLNEEVLVSSQDFKNFKSLSSFLKFFEEKLNEVSA